MIIPNHKSFPNENKQKTKFISLISKYSRTHTITTSVFERDIPLDLWRSLKGCKKDIWRYPRGTISTVHRSRQKSRPGKFRWGYQLANCTKDTIHWWQCALNYERKQVKDLEAVKWNIMVWPFPFTADFARWWCAHGVNAGGVANSS
jgi:hypothetical protein